MQYHLEIDGESLCLWALGLEEYDSENVTRLAGLDNENKCWDTTSCSSNGRKGFASNRTCSGQRLESASRKWATSVTFLVSSLSWTDCKVSGILEKEVDCCSVPRSPGEVPRHRGQEALSPAPRFHAQLWFGLPCHLLVGFTVFYQVQSWRNLMAVDFRASK